MQVFPKVDNSVNDAKIVLLEQNKFSKKKLQQLSPESLVINMSQSPPLGFG